MNMKKIIVFSFFLGLQSALQAAMFTPEPDPSSGLLSPGDEAVPSLGYCLSLSTPDPLITQRERATLRRAHTLIVHGQTTNQLKPFSKKKRERPTATEALSRELLALDIWGVDDEGRLDPRLTSLHKLLVQNPLAHQIVPCNFDEDGEPHTVPEYQKSVKPVCRNLFNNGELD
jgi:hypothetical protein